MPHQSHTITSGSLLKHLMRHPGPNGATHTTASLAKLAGISTSKIQKLISGARPHVTEQEAAAIAAAVGADVTALFLPRSFLFRNEKETEMDPADRTLRARLAAHTQWAKTEDRTARTAKARAGAEARWEKAAREMYPDGDDALIARTAESLRKAHYARMGMRSGAARRKGAAKRAA